LLVDVRKNGLDTRVGEALHQAIAESLDTRVILCLDQAQIESAKTLRITIARL
jgi:hypothetical protein